MARTLPSSLSPHICILHSSDLKDVLESHALPLLPQILQSFSPLQQITTRTTALAPIPLSSFALRFSDLVEIETAIHEDEEQRAERMMDWIGNRVQPRCATWVELVQSHIAAGEGPWKDRTPWWEEVKRCVESDHVPSRAEGWNHPVAIIYAVSTAAPNPLQALQELHTRMIDFPPWVDVAFLRYSLIVHPSNSPLSESIAESLFNAVKKQYGLHTYLLPLSLPTSPPPAPVPIPFIMPRLPPIPTPDVSPMSLSQPAPAAASSKPSSSTTPRVQSSESLAGASNISPRDANTLLLCEGDIQQFGRFTREFATMSLIPWMEKAVMEWNELYSTSRRLPSRLFSSTRRLFGSGYSTPVSTPPIPGHGSNPSISSTASRGGTHGPNSSVSSLASITSAGSGSNGAYVSQQRRLAEFATILGDFKLAISVWESLRKEGKGGADILPLLLSPSPALPLLAANSVQTNHAQFHDWPALAQMRSLVNAVRWDIGIDQRELLGSILEGERWLVQAAGAAEEVPTALLLAHAAFLSSKKGATRRSALWYMRAADRLEKAGIKPLAMHFFRRAHQQYKSPRSSELSPSFWESEGRSQFSWRGFDAILPGIEHELGRLLYTTGDTAGAVQYFLGLLQEHKTVSSTPAEGLGITINGTSHEGKHGGADKVYLEDFRVALKHFKTTESERFATSELKLNLKFCQIKHTRIRLPGDALNGDSDEWNNREADWTTFRKSRGAEKLHVGGRAAVNETFWADLAIRNPLDVDVTLSALTIVLREVSSPESGKCPDFVDVEVIDDVQLGAKESRTIPIGIRSSKPSSLVLTHVRYHFLDLLPAEESLATRGRRLYDTPHQRQNKVYAPDILLRVDVEDALHRLQAGFVDNRHLLLAEGECRQMTVRVLNSGKHPIAELWMVSGSDDELWIGGDEESTVASSETENFQSSNSLSPHEPYRVTIEKFHSSKTLGPGETLDVPVIVHSTRSGENSLCILLTFRETADQAFYSTRLIRQYEVRPILGFSWSIRPHQSSSHEYIINVGVENKTLGTSIQIVQVTTMSPAWGCTPLASNVIGLLPASQHVRATFGVDRLVDLNPDVLASREFVKDKLRSVLHGTTVEVSDPPPTRLHCRHLCGSDMALSLKDPALHHFLHADRRNQVTHRLSAQNPHIPQSSHRSIFPLYPPSALDLVIFWEIPSQERKGHILLPIGNLGADHAPLSEVLDTVDNLKAKRSMYAETERERRELIEAIRSSEWNAETNPITLAVSDGMTVEHDFASRPPCHVTIKFTIRNYSLTNPARYALTLPSSPQQPFESAATLSPRFVGRSTQRGELLPSQARIISLNLSIPHPGTYTLGDWTIETEVGESETSPQWVTRHRYKQLSPSRCRVTVIDRSRS
ncbi:ER-golgi trafficking TRAPP I complex 85 kDa subunit-domain-containing protein [Cristinia sonorae]|uniref:ER-golgi trafficking TRAPP I complex 85 kDa subunit-domain-containing protein n=1 Tax=Cristinia sonorae TaxID=1940300 RepID=A0A8K0URE6_9AGAR|nr:ER-golgi trafficking TRAPP I complex 85 kDa subunit-domain-containing protein [Cristinia sonorae]